MELQTHTPLAPQTGYSCVLAPRSETTASHDLVRRDANTCARTRVRTVSAPQRCPRRGLPPVCTGPCWRGRRPGHGATPVCTSRCGWGTPRSAANSLWGGVHVKVGVHGSDSASQYIFAQRWHARKSLVTHGPSKLYRQYGQRFAHGTVTAL